MKLIQFIGPLEARTYLRIYDFKGNNIFNGTAQALSYDVLNYSLREKEVFKVCLNFKYLDITIYEQNN